MGKPLPARLRTYHRWVAGAAVVILTWISVTGLALVTDLIAEPKLPHQPPAASFTREEAAAAVGAALSGGDLPLAKATEVQLVLALNGETVQVRHLAIAAGATTRTFAPAADGGMVAAPPTPGPAFSPYLQFRIRLHVLLEKLHRGNIIGLPGQMLSVLGGLSFIFLTVSGVWMYVDLVLKRRRTGRRALFWK